MESGSVVDRASTPHSMGSRSRLSTPVAHLHKQSFAVSADTSSFRHTVLAEQTSLPRPGSQNLTHERVRDVLSHQRHIKQHMASIQMQSSAPSLVRLFSASIKSPYSPPAPLSSNPGHRREFLQEIASTRHSAKQIHQLTTERIVLDPLHIEPLDECIPQNAYGKRTVDRRPDSSNALILYRERLHEEERGMVHKEKEVMCDRPVSPYRTASPRNDPSRVYTPAGVKDLLRSCSVKEEASPMFHVRRMQTEAEVSRKDREAEAERHRRDATVGDAVRERAGGNQRVHESYSQLQRSSAQLSRGRTPTTVTKSVRGRIGSVRQHLIRKSMSAADMQSEMSMTMGSQQPSSFGGSQSGPSSKGQENDGLLATHRKGIVKRMYNL